jgi:ketosteroid isomerase-like protein
VHGRAVGQQSRRMGPSTDIRFEHEGVVARLKDAYDRREFEKLLQLCRPDVELTLAGTSRLAGTYQGRRSLSELARSIRPVLRPLGKAFTVERQDDDAIEVSQGVELAGPEHSAEMPVRVTIRFHPDGLVQSFRVEAGDQGLFDHVVDSAGGGT